MGSPDPHLGSNGKLHIWLSKLNHSYKKADPPLECVKPIPMQLVSHAVNQLQADDLLRMVAAGFGLTYQRVGKATLLKNLEVFFRACMEEGKRALLIVDEAQGLPPRAIGCSSLFKMGTPVSIAHEQLVPFSRIQGTFRRSYATRV